jgi:hypothetical protein
MTMNDEFLPLTRQEVATWWNAIVFSTCLYLLGAGIVTSLIMFPIVLICTHVNYGARWVMRAGFALLVLTVLVTVGAVPEPSKWRDLRDVAIASATTVLQERIAARKE